MPELRLPELTSPNPTGMARWAGDLIFQLRRQWSPLLRRLANLAPYGLQAVDGPGTVFTLPWLKVDETTVQCSGTATLTAAALVRPGLCFGVFARNLTVVSGAGLVDYKIGTTTPPDDDAWAAGHVLTLNNLEDTSPWIRVADFGANPPVKYDAATDIVLTGNGGTLDSGSIQLIAFTLDFLPNE